MTDDARTRRLRALLDQMLLPRREGEYQGGAEARHFYARELAAVLDTEGDASPAPRWQPIETAPKDGTNVLLWWPFWCKGRPTIGYFGFHGIQQWAAPEVLEGDGDPPTHWMPLPDPPVQP